LTDRLFCNCHESRIHQVAPECTTGPDSACPAKTTRATETTPRACPHHGYAFARHRPAPALHVERIGRRFSVEPRGLEHCKRCPLFFALRLWRPWR
jgi:hypothetical protein